MAGAAAAGRYAKALFQLGKETGSVASLREELAVFNGLVLDNPDLATVLMEPVYPAAERRAVLVGVTEKLNTSTTLRSFYSFLVDQRRLVDLVGIEEAYGDLADADAGLTKAHVRTASPLTDDQRSRLQRALSQRTGRDVELDVEIDPTLLGGVIAKVGDTLYDGSLRSQLDQLRANLGKSVS